MGCEDGFCVGRCPQFVSFSESRVTALTTRRLPSYITNVQQRHRHRQRKLNVKCDTIENICAYFSVSGKVLRFLQSALARAWPSDHLDALPRGNLDPFCIPQLRYAASIMPYFELVPSTSFKAFKRCAPKRDLCQESYDWRQPVNAASLFHFLWRTLPAYQSASSSPLNFQWF
jgi:hypothetical protein